MIITYLQKKFRESKKIKNLVYTGITLVGLAITYYGINTENQLKYENAPDINTKRKIVKAIDAREIAGDQKPLEYIVPKVKQLNKQSQTNSIDSLINEISYGINTNNQDRINRNYDYIKEICGKEIASYEDNVIVFLAVTGAGIGISCLGLIKLYGEKYKSKR